MSKTNIQFTMVSRSQKEKDGVMHSDDFRASLYGKTLVLCGVLDCLLAGTILWFPCVSCNTTMIFNSFAMLMIFIKLTKHHTLLFVKKCTHIGCLVHID